MPKNKTGQSEYFDFVLFCEPGWTGFKLIRGRFESKNRAQPGKTGSGMKALLILSVTISLGWQQRL